MDKKVLKSHFLKTNTQQNAIAMRCLSNENANKPVKVSLNWLWEIHIMVMQDSIVIISSSIDPRCYY